MPAEEIKTLAVLGCGARGRIYAGVAAEAQGKFRLVAACDPVAVRTQFVRDVSGYAGFREFADSDAFFAAGKLADALVIATLEPLHYEQCRRALDLGYDILLEKSIADNHEHVLAIEEQARRLGRTVMICHVLRYAPFFVAMRDLVAAGEIGEVVNFEAMEGVEPWHMAHSFVRGHWAREEDSLPMLVIKSCHDMDILAWLVGRPCEAISAFGSLSRFTRDHAPAGAPRRCADGCPVGETCFYNARKYTTPEGQHRLRMVYDNPDTSPGAIGEWLKTSPWGRCVYHCDNSAPDHISVAMRFTGGVTGVFTLSAFEEGRHYAIFGTRGVLRGGPAIKRTTGADILIQPHGGGEARRIVVAPKGTGHGGNAALVHAFHDELTGRGDGRTLIGSSVQSHAMAFAADLARRTGRTVTIHDNRF